MTTRCMAPTPSGQLCGYGPLWDHGKPGPVGLCYWHDKQRQANNGGLPIAEITTSPLAQLMTRYDREAEMALARWSGDR
jgi:hypothetical protein